MLDHEAGVSKAIDVWQFIPIRRISVIDIQRHRLAHLVVPSTNYQQQCSHKQTTMLVPFRRLWTVAIWSLHPVQPSISMPSQTPSIVQRHSVSPPSSENHHHATGCTRATYTRRMVHSRWRVFLPHQYLLPNAIAQNVDFPYVPDCLRAGVSAVDDDVRFEICHNVAIPGARRTTLAIFDRPVCLVR